MAVLTTKKRKGLKKSTFGLPGQRKYPMPDRSHAANAKARATQQYNKGNLSKSALNHIHAMANKILNGASKTTKRKKVVKSTKKRYSRSTKK